MAGLPPLRSMRKTTVVLIVVFLAFITHRIVDFVLDDSSIKDVGNTELSLAQGVVCRHIVKETPFGADSVFEEGSRLYFYTIISNALQYDSDSLLHVWYKGMDTVQVLLCKVRKDYEACYTEISPSMLTTGEWSVDLVLGRRLLYSEQFLIESTDR